MEKSKGKFFYGWVIVFVLFLVNFMPMVIVQNYMSYYQFPMCTEFNSTYVEFSLSSTLGSVAGIVFSLTLAGKLSKGSTKRWMLYCGLIAGVFLILQSFVTAMWQFWITNFIVSFAFNGLTFIPINTLLARWFVDKKGLATSLVFFGNGLGGMVFSKVLANIIANQGWRFSFRFSALVTIVVALVIGLLVQNYPSDIGLEPYHETKEAKNEDSTPVQAPVMGMTKTEALKTPAFYAYILTILCAGILATIALTQIPTYIIEMGNDYALVMICYSAAGCVTKLVLGPIFDKAGIVVGGSICGIAVVVGMVCMLMVPQGIIFGMVGAAILGFNSIHTFVTPFMTGKLFGYREFAQIFGLANVAFMLGCMIGPMISSSIRTVSGSYSAAWYITIAVAVAYLVFLVVGMRFQKSCQAKWH